MDIPETRLIALGEAPNRRTPNSNKTERGKYAVGKGTTTSQIEGEISWHAKRR